MKSIRINKASGSATYFDYHVSLPIVVKPALVRNVSYSLQEAEKANPETGLLISDYKMNLLNSYPTELAQFNKMITDGLITVEDVFSPFEFMKVPGTAPKYEIEDANNLPKLFKDGAESAFYTSPAELLNLEPNDNNVASLHILHEISVSNYNGTGKTLVVPVECRLEDPVPAGVALTATTDGSGNVTTSYSLDIDGSVQYASGAKLKLVVTLDMSKAKVYASAEDTTGTAINNTEISSWKVSRIFNVSVAEFTATTTTQEETVVPEDNTGDNTTETTETNDTENPENSGVENNG